MKETLTKRKRTSPRLPPSHLKHPNLLIIEDHSERRVLLHRHACAVSEDLVREREEATVAPPVVRVVLQVHQESESVAQNPAYPFVSTGHQVPWVPQHDVRPDFLQDWVL